MLSTIQSKKYYYSWIVLSVLSLLYLLENFDRYLIAVSVIPYIDYASYEYSLLVGPVFTIIYAVGGLLFSLAHNDSGDGVLRKVSSGKFAVLFLSTLIFSISFGLTALCNNFWQQVLVRVVMGLAQSVITPFSASIIRGVFPPDQCGTAFSIFNVGVYLAFSMSLSLGVWLYDEYGWKMGYLLFGLIGAGFSFVIPLLACWSARSSAFIDEKLLVVSSYNPLVNNEHSVTLSGIHDFAGNNVSRSTDTSNNSSMVTSQPTIVQHLSIVSESSDLSLNSLETVAISQRRIGNRTSDEFSVDENPYSSSSRKSNENDEVNTLNAFTYYCQWSHVQSSWSLVKSKLHRIVVDHWWQNPSIIFLCFATGIRLGAGYVWSSYTGPFFSGLFVHQENSINCNFSYDGDLVQEWAGQMCASEAFPYCVAGICSSVSRFPWHNKGMDPMNLAAYMSWVPLIGSGLGNLIGGIVSDKVIRGDWLLFSSRNGVSFQSDISHQQPNRSHWRALISGISTLLSLPFVCISFYLDFPGCFLILIVSGLLGEMYLSQTLALITEPSFISADLITPSVALFILLTTAIAGNATLLVPFLENFTNQEKVTITFQAAPSDPTVTGKVWMSVSQTSVEQLQQALVYAMIFCYGLSGFLYVCAYWTMVRKSSLH